MFKVKCSCGVDIQFNSYKMNIPEEPGQISFSEIKCPVCGKEVEVYTGFQKGDMDD